MDAKRRDLRPVIAGRWAGQIEKLATELSLRARVFDLDDVPSTTAALADMAVVANCAGPFAATIALRLLAGMDMRDSRVRNYPPRWNGAPSQGLLAIQKGDPAKPVPSQSTRSGPQISARSGPESHGMALTSR